MVSAKTSIRPALTISFALLAVVLGLAPAGCGTPAAKGPTDTFGLDLSIPAGARTDGAIVFLCDGVNADIFEEMLNAGELPAVKRYFVDRGLYVPHAVANVPSVTLANLTSVATGAFPGRHGITGINWFDRNMLIWRNYETIAQKNTLDGDYESLNVYERLPGRTTVSVFFQPHRRATKFIENWTSAGPPFYFGWYEFVDRLTLFRLGLVAQIARQRHEWPAVTVVYLLATDFAAYGEGVLSAHYRQTLRDTDFQIGRVCGDLERAGLLDKLHLVLVSDHGMEEVTRHFPLDAFLRARGLDVAKDHLWEQTPFEKRLDYYRRFPVVTYGSGDRYFAICLRKPVRSAGKPAEYEAWPVRPTMEDLRNYPAGEDETPTDLIDMLVSQEAVDAVAWSTTPADERQAGPSCVYVALAGGEVEFRQAADPDGAISYRLVRGDDPLGWRGHVADELLSGTPADGRRWLDETGSTDFPDLPAQIVSYFRARRAGDLAVFAAPGWDFRESNKAGHGGLRRIEMTVPLIVAGPGVTPRRAETARTVDIVPTILELLGRRLPDDLDGAPLLPAPARE
jgi:hypothetical protein